MCCCLAVSFASFIGGLRILERTGKRPSIMESSIVGICIRGRPVAQNTSTALNSCSNHVLARVRNCQTFGLSLRFHLNCLPLRLLASSLFFGFGQKGCSICLNRCARWVVVGSGSSGSPS